jgi:hypothetical protein
MEGVMATDTATGGVWLLRAALLVTTALILSIGSPASARVGVTSGADGDPLGKPPNENERILRIGIDVQANELITTAANDRAHLVFLDGSALTVGPNARLTIDRFVYDPNTQKGELAINATKGVFRLVGGKISKTNAITITTPSSTIGIRGGITILSVTQVQTIAAFVFGNSMTVTAGGQTQTATRAGSQVTTNAGGAPGKASLFNTGGLTAALSQLEGGSSNNNNSADQSAQSSGFSGKNSGQPPSTTPNFNQNGPPNTTNNALTNTVSNTNPASQPLGNSTPQNQKTPTTNTPTTTTPTTTTSTTNTTTTNTTTTSNNNPPPSGPTRTSQTLTGFTSGVTLTLRRVEGGDYVPDSARLGLLKQGQVSITTDATNSQARATIVVQDFNGSQHHHYHQSSTATFQLGGTGGLGATNSAFADDKTFVIGTQTNDPSRLSTLRKGDHTPRALNDSTLLSSSNAAPVPLPSNPGCTCEFLSWGSWASIVPDAHDPNKATQVRGNYVAGQVPTVALPTMGSATYTGFMSGIAQQGSNPRYAATGSYQNVWSFTNRSGAFTGSFDGRGYSGTMLAPESTTSTTFAGNINSTSGHHRSGSMSGGFFSSPNSASPMPAYQAGTFSIGNGSSRYQATGIFAGQR